MLRIWRSVDLGQDVWYICVTNRPVRLAPHSDGLEAHRL